MDAEEGARERADAEGVVKEAKEAIVAFKKLHDEVDKGRANIYRRFLGHVRFSPSIELRAGPHKYTQDYALVEIDSSKIDATSFTGTVGRVHPFDVPNAKNRHAFKYPTNRLFKVQGIASDEEMRSRTISDQRTTIRAWQYHWSDRRPR